MKNTIKLFMVAAAFFISGNLFAQTVTDYQNRLHDLTLCKSYMESVMTPEQFSAVLASMNAITDKLNGANQQALPQTPFDIFIAQNPQDPDVMAYLKVLSICLEPTTLIGRSLTPTELSNYQASLTAMEATITQKF
jgi:hypothetical protein